MPLLKAFSTTVFLTICRRQSTLPSCCTSLPNSLLRFLPALLLPHTLLQSSYRDLHLLWPSFNTSKWELSPALGTPAPRAEYFPLSQGRAAGWKETALHEVVGQIQGVRAAQAFPFAGMTQHHVPDKEIAASEQQEMGKTCWIWEELDPALLQLQRGLNTAPGRLFWGLAWQNRVARV